MILIIFAYWFFVVAYLLYFDHFIEGNCSSFWRCYLQNFDWISKTDGAVGGFLVDPALNDDGARRPIEPQYHYDENGEVILDEVFYYPFLGRFIYDTLLLFMLAILMN